MDGKAWFVFEPRRIDDLAFGGQAGKWMEYHVVKTICLSQIDFENFATDLLADRQFIEDNIGLCVKRDDCLLVTDRQRSSELLVIPWRGCFVRYAALRLKIFLV